MLVVDYPLLIIYLINNKLMSNQLQNTTNEKIVEYLEKSYKIIQRLTETNRLINIKNKELMKKVIYLQTQIQLLEKQKIKKINEKEIDEFEFVN